MVTALAAAWHGVGSDHAGSLWRCGALCATHDTSITPAHHCTACRTVPWMQCCRCSPAAVEIQQDLGSKIGERQSERRHELSTTRPNGTHSGAMRGGKVVLRFLFTPIRPPLYVWVRTLMLMSGVYSIYIHSPASGAVSGTLFHVNSTYYRSGTRICPISDRFVPTC